MRDVEQAGGEALAIPTDVAKHEQVEAAAEKVERDWGLIDVWVNNAMATIFCSVARVKPEDFVRSTEVTYLRSIPLQSTCCGAKSAIHRLGAPSKRSSARACCPAYWTTNLRTAPTAGR